MTHTVLEEDEVSVLKRLKQRLQRDLDIQRDWWLNWGFLVPEGQASQEALDKGYSSQDKLESKLDMRRLPKSKYARAVLSSHLVGWAPDVELFGVAQHKRMAITEELVASRKPWRILKVKT